MADLFTPLLQPSGSQPEVHNLGDGIFHIKQFAPSELCLHLISLITEQAPLRQMMTPMGHLTQVKMTNCGQYGWISDSNGYRYSPIDPTSQKSWPAMPDALLKIHKEACELAGLTSFKPDACLINHYDIGLAMGRHQDKDELDLSWPIVSISIGLPAVFQVFSMQRNSPAKNILLEDGDVIILSGQSRSFYHGVKPIKADILQPNLSQRFNLTLRKSH
ncbi:alpha-ketoglutarate-dependent dioxygenase AlkB [Pseudomonas sp. HK3]